MTAPVGSASAISRQNQMDVRGEDRVYRLLERCWHPVIYSHELTDAPKGVVLCERRLVLVRLDGAPRAFDDLCAHRGTALSLGEVVDGDLRCPYHGWRYDATGRCTLAPQRPDLSQHLKVRLRSYQAVERYGMVWVCLADEPAFPLPEFPQYDDPAHETITIPSSDWRCSAPRRTENYVDLGHFAFVHDGVLGDIEHPEIPAHRVWRDGHALRMELDEPAIEPRDAGKSAALDTDAEEVLEVWSTWHLFMPLTVLLDSTMAEGQHYCLFFHPTPLGPKQIRNFTIGARNFGDPEKMYEEIVEFNFLVYGQDQPVVESQRPEELPEDLSEELHLKGVDTYSVHYRRWLLEAAGAL
jgi:vanillate O-demethylase monooxygenase subunit